MPKHLLPILVGLLLLAGLAAAVIVRPLHAEGQDQHHIVYLNITGEGATAKAWYKGAPPSGVLVQEALDYFSAQGYRVASVSPSQRPIVQAVVQDTGQIANPTEEEQFFIVLLEK